MNLSIRVQLFLMVFFGDVRKFMSIENNCCERRNFTFSSSVDKLIFIKFCVIC